MATTNASQELGTPSNAGISRRDRTGRRLLLVLAVALVAAVIGSLTIGPTGISLVDLGTILEAWRSGTWSTEAERAYLVLVDLRLPRTLIGCFAGAALAVSEPCVLPQFCSP